MNVQERRDEIIGLYVAGRTMGEIGAHFGLTGERIRQILRAAGISSREGGRQKRSIERKKLDECKYLEKIWNRYGCDPYTYRYLRNNKVTRIFQRQRENARKRGIEWQLTLGEWWDIWDRSGKFKERGVGRNKFVMSRHGDIGPYSVDNVSIVRGCDNNAEWANRYWGEVRSGQRMR